MTERGGAAARRVSLAVVGLAILGGVYLRVVSIGDQIVHDDELHAVGLAVSRGYRTIASHFFGADACIPLTLLTKLMGDWIGVSEVTLRLPVLFAGVASLVVLPKLVWDRFGPEVAASFACLLAISPILVRYSRYARPYGISALLTTVALFAFHDWLRSRRRGSAVLYGVCATLAVYFHLLAVLAAVVAPIVYAAFLLRSRWRDQCAVTPRDVLVLAALTGLGIGALLAPAFVNTPMAMLGKAVQQPIDQRSLVGAIYLLSGTSAGSLASSFWAMAAVGSYFCLVRQPALGLLLLLAIAIQLAGVIGAAPSQVQISIVFARYCSFVLPILLVLASIPFGELARRLGGERSALVPGLGLMAAAWLFWNGPIPSAYSRTNNFTNHSELLPLGQSREPLGPDDLGHGYPALAADDEEFEIIEAPWYFNWQADRFGTWQEAHGKGVIVGLLEPEGSERTIYNFPARDPMLKFRRFLDLHDRAAVESSGARYLVLHRHLSEEVGPRFNRGLESPSTIGIESLYRSWFGPAAFEDAYTAVFSLQRGPDPWRASRLQKARSGGPPDRVPEPEPWVGPLAALACLAWLRARAARAAITRVRRAARGSPHRGP